MVARKNPAGRKKSLTLLEPKTLRTKSQVVRRTINQAKKMYEHKIAVGISERSKKLSTLRTAQNCYHRCQIGPK